MAITTAILRRRRDRGIKALDIHEAPGWRDRIECKDLNLGSTAGCILGQLYGSFWKCVENDHSLPGFVSYHGQSVVSLGFDLEIPDHDRLTKVWKEVLCQD